MNLTKLVERLADQDNNSIISFENGEVIRRTHAAIYADVTAACANLKEWGVMPGMRVGLRAANCYAWIVYDLALIDLRAISVVFTDDFASQTVEQLLQQYSLSLMVTSSTETRDSTPNHSVVFLDKKNSEVKVLDCGPPSADDNFEKIGLVFSSGSSGQLKGLILNRRGIEASVDAFTQAVVPRHDDCLLLFLPMSNFQQRLMYYSALWYGFDLIVTDPSRLFRAFKDLHPTILIAPPMLYETFATRFSNMPKWKQQVALVAGKMIHKLPSQTARAKIAKLVFKEVYEALGGRMRFMITGMAPIKRSTLELFRLMHLPLFETYGLTEFGNIALNLPGACKQGSVGRLLPGVQIEIAADGEIIALRENTIATGYFECAAGEAEKTFLGNNRIATGDIGRFDEDGYLYLIGRKKEIIITAGGEKVHPEILESEIEACPDVARAVVFSHAEEPGLIAMVLAKNLEDPDARVRIEHFIEAIGEDRPSTSVHKLVFIDVVFSRENGFLRPNLKLNRQKIAQYFLPGISAGAAARSA